MKNILKNNMGSYTAIPNHIIRNPFISGLSKAVFCYMASRPNDWEFHSSEIIKNFKEGRDAIRNAINELCDATYIVKYQERNKGKFTKYIYEINYSPSPENPAPENPSPENPSLTNKDNTKTDINKKIISKDITKKPKISLEELSTDHITDWLARMRARGKYIHHDEEHVLEIFKNYCRSKERRYKDYVAAYKNAFEWGSGKEKQKSGNSKTAHEAFAEGAYRFATE